MAETTARHLKKVPRILIVEDTGSISHLLGYFLGREGYEVQSTGSPSQAIELALRWAPHLVLLDVRLPGQSGFDIARALRSSPLLPSLRIVFISGRQTPEDLAQAAGVGASAYLEKPFRMESFLGVVRRAVEQLEC